MEAPSGLPGHLPERPPFAKRLLVFRFSGDVEGGRRSVLAAATGMRIGDTSKGSPHKDMPGSMEDSDAGCRVELSRLGLTYWEIVVKPLSGRTPDAARVAALARVKSRDVV